MQAGTYLAEATDATVIESDGGAITIGFHFVCDDGHGEVNGFQCIIGKTGIPNEIGIKALREAWPLWDGADPFWFQDIKNLAGVKVSIVLDFEEYDGKTRLKVKYINNPDRPQSGLPKSMDRASFMQRHGARMRAAAGGVVVKAPGAPGTPGTPGTLRTLGAPGSRPALRSPVVRPPAVGSATLQEAWDSLCAQRGGVDENTINAEWTETVDRVTGGKNQDQITPQEWFTIKSKWLPI